MYILYKNVYPAVRNDTHKKDLSSIEFLFTLIWHWNIALENYNCRKFNAENTCYKKKDLGQGYTKLGGGVAQGLLPMPMGIVDIREN